MSLDPVSCGSLTCVGDRALPELRRRLKIFVAILKQSVIEKALPHLSLQAWAPRASQSVARRCPSVTVQATWHPGLLAPSQI